MKSYLPNHSQIENNKMYYLDIRLNNKRLEYHVPYVYIDVCLGSSVTQTMPSMVSPYDDGMDTCVCF